MLFIDKINATNQPLITQCNLNQYTADDVRIKGKNTLSAVFDKSESGRGRK